jgi:hypothetical protein
MKWSRSVIHPTAEVIDLMEALKNSFGAPKTTEKESKMPNIFENFDLTQTIVLECALGIESGKAERRAKRDPFQRGRLEVTNHLLSEVREHLEALQSPGDDCSCAGEDPSMTEFAECRDDEPVYMDEPA